MRYVAYQVVYDGEIFSNEVKIPADLPDSMCRLIGMGLIFGDSWCLSEDTPYQISVGILGEDRVIDTYGNFAEAFGAAKMNLA